ncbi:hypothetical protein A2415_05310 [candidate division WWE3 bacterium RIFOXYC1_FULL_39_7]|uniref:Uncharacterized protein n=1 Tax=candidate division WWE3 bacterium RIFOXYC1_FULL_39_7 TaxID=1802643 RepID=A0A1F4WJF1_UNCKA|nr:MAG: hypothetical protein A2415_05310 [candidate division WWE3 bacterium RIFOXYC1_FULL_39_7]
MGLTLVKSQCENESVIKKYWPVALLIVGLLIFGGVYFFVIRGGDELPVEEEEVVAEIPLDMRPVVSLTPTSDGHYLNLLIEGIKLAAYTLDYELLYQTGEGATQGVPGSIKLDGKDSFESELLLGSESSGKFRYDTGVNEGTLTLRFRDEKGKLLGKLSTDFHLVTGTDELASLDGNFNFMLDGDEDEYYVVMETFGPYEMAYGVFGSVKPEGEPGEGWDEVSDGIFVQVASE